MTLSVPEFSKLAPRMCVATGTAAARVRGAAGRLRQAGLRKQAARRWLAAQGARLSRHDPVYLGDDLYTRQPIRAAVLNERNRSERRARVERSG